MNWKKHSGGCTVDYYWTYDTEEEQEELDELYYDIMGTAHRELEKAFKERGEKLDIKYQG